jgi:acetyltransferase-like isoleucine patch superfamily enzyme
MLKQLLQKLLRRIAHGTGRLSGLYRRVCRPNGEEWAVYVKRYGGLYAMGENCSVQTNVAITDPAYTRLGDNVRLSGCTLFGHDGAVVMAKICTGLPLDAVGRIDIRSNVFVGHQAIIMPGVTIGPNAIVAAGAVVTRDVPPNSIVAGVPARQISTFDAYVHNRVAATAGLPWASDPQLRPDFTSNASRELTQQRQAFFFGSHHGPHSGSLSS